MTVEPLLVTSENRSPQIEQVVKDHSVIGLCVGLVVFFSQRRRKKKEKNNNRYLDGNHDGTSSCGVPLINVRLGVNEVIQQRGINWRQAGIIKRRSSLCVNCLQRSCLFQQRMNHLAHARTYTHIKKEVNEKLADKGEKNLSYIQITVRAGEVERSFSIFPLDIDLCSI